MSAATITPTPLRMTSWATPQQAPQLSSPQSISAVSPLSPFRLRDGDGVTYAGDAVGTVHYRFTFPRAAAVAVAPPCPTTLDGEVDKTGYDTHAVVTLQRQQNGVWHGTTTYAIGPHKVVLLVDGRAVLTPHLPITCEHNQELMNYIDVPPCEQASCIYIMRPRTEHGSVAQDYVASYTTDTVEEVLAYLPPSYHKPQCATRRYPVLYLLHDDGDHVMGSVQHGKVNIIADNLIADGKMAEMIIVMKSHLTSATADAFSNDLTELCDDLTEDIIPYIDNRYRTKADRDNRAIAGLSMGSMQASRLSITRPDLFAYAGVFSGFLCLVRSDIGANDDHMEVLRRDPAAYQSAMKVFFRCMGDEDVHMPRFEEDDAILAEMGVQCTRRIYKGPHSWHVWRQAAPEFLSTLFKPVRK